MPSYFSAVADSCSPMRPSSLLARPASQEWLFAIKAFSAAMLAFTCSIHLGLERPYWAMMTAYIVAQPFASLSLVKGASRLAGTCVGGMAALLLTTLFVQWPLLHLTALALWLGLCIFLSLLEQSLFSYAFLLSGYTTLFITLPYVDHPDTLFMVALNRVEEIAIGISCYLLLDLLLWPRRTDARFVQQLAQWQQQLFGWQQQLLQGATTDNQDDDAATIGPDALLLQLGQLEQLRPQALSDSARLRAHQAVLIELHGELQAQLTLGLALSDLLQPLSAAQRQDPSLQALLSEAQQALAMLQRGERLGAPSPALQAQSHTGALTPAAQLAALLGYWWQSHHLIQQLNGVLEQAPTRRRRTRRSYPHVDVGRALQAAATGSISLLLCGLGWMLTGWSSGYLAVMMTGVACSLFAASDNPLLPAKGFFIGSLLSIPIAGVLLFGLLPFVDDLPGMIAVLLPFFIWGGRRMARPATAARTVPLVLGTLAMLTLNNDTRMSFSTFLNMGVAQQVGIGIPLLLTGVLRRLGAQVQLPRLQRALEQALLRVARPGSGVSRAAFESHGQAILLGMVQRCGDEARSVLGGGGALIRMGLGLLRLESLSGRLLPHGRKALQASREALSAFFSLPPAQRASAFPVLMQTLEQSRQLLLQPAGATPPAALQQFDHLLLALRLHQPFFIRALWR